jgi:signal recognition particle GTPase
VNDLVKKGEEQRDDFKKMIRDEILESLDYKDIARKEDLMKKDDVRKIIREELIDILKEKEIATKTDISELKK